ncbi:hypothetical protein EC957_003179 [Mortierella hygrophila]|uniref:Uncharacterized protein n=1 Tax=Mortierella hygrophila TaxID=979708 RepID=A0A9P6FGN3_9FUNG|nr:hypothetical protein EC957_003179 [Mortierella hygrophila]
MPGMTYLFPAEHLGAAAAAAADDIANGGLSMYAFVYGLAVAIASELLIVTSGHIVVGDAAVIGV